MNNRSILNAAILNFTILNLINLINLINLNCIFSKLSNLRTYFKYQLHTSLGSIPYLLFYVIDSNYCKRLS